MAGTPSPRSKIRNTGKYPRPVDIHSMRLNGRKKFFCLRWQSKFISWLCIELNLGAKVAATTNSKDVRVCGWPLNLQTGKLISIVSHSALPTFSTHIQLIRLHSLMVAKSKLRDVKNFFSNWKGKLKALLSAITDNCRSEQIEGYTEKEQEKENSVSVGE